MASQLTRRWRAGGGKEQYKVHAADILDEDELGESDPVEAGLAALSDSERELPKWLRYAKVSAKKYWTRPLLGGDERPRGVVSFLLDVLHWNGTVFRRAVPQALLSGVLTLVVIGFQRYVNDVPYPLRTLSPDFFLPFFLLTLVVLVARLCGAWHSYRKGHEMVLQMQASAVDLLLTCTTSIHVRNSGMDMLEMVRRLNVLLAFIRQDLRESRHHVTEHTTFKAGQKKSRLAKEWFYSSEDKFVRDPYGAPPLRLLLTPSEVEVYKTQSTTDRILVCTIAIRTLFAKHVNIGEKKMSTPDTTIFRENLQSIVHSWGKCREIVRTPPPFVLHHLALCLTLAQSMFFAPPFFATNTTGFFAVFASMFLTFGLYALEEAACEMEVPFGWRASDCNLTKMCRNLLKRSLAFCKICKITAPPPQQQQPHKAGRVAAGAAAQPPNGGLHDAEPAEPLRSPQAADQAKGPPPPLSPPPHAGKQQLKQHPDE